MIEIMEEPTSAGPEQAPPGIDVSVPHPARMYDYYLGGEDNFAADRAAAELAIAAAPDMVTTARANRAFLGRAVRFLADAGVEQILDIGTGIPTAGNTHQIAHAVDPSIRVVSVDNDPMVLAHANALMAGQGTGSTAVLQADLRDPEAILTDPRVTALIDFSRPVALLLVAVLHFIKDEEDPARLVRILRERLAPGSYLCISQCTLDFGDEETGERLREVYKRATAPLVPRTRAEVAAFFGEFEPVEPGLVHLPLWRPDHEVTEDHLARVHFYAGIGRSSL